MLLACDTMTKIVGGSNDFLTCGLKFKNLTLTTILPQNFVNRVIYHRAGGGSQNFADFSDFQSTNLVLTHTAKNAKHIHKN